MSQEIFIINNLWMMIATALVFIMHLGFATVESGLSRSKNTINILFKNTIIPAIGLITYCLWGFNLMFPGGEYKGMFIGFTGYLGLSVPANGLTSEYASGQYTYWTFFLFQAMFAATAATIVSGAVAERVKIWGFLIHSLILVGVLYPIIGMWTWGGGFLASIGFHDFAGSSIVHSTGGWAALAGVIILGPRIGKYVDGKILPIPGHSMPLATIGVFMLWLGWFGFNGGSVLSADPGKVSLVLVNTSLAAAAGALSAMFTSYFVTKTLDHSLMLNGILGGLVAITAGADLMSPAEAIVIGIIAGFLVVYAILMFDKLKVDDPVGATSVHLVCGIFGTLAVGFFGAKKGPDQLVSQLIGIGCVGGLSFTASIGIFLLIEKTIGLRVSAKEELEGLDIGRHGMKAYNIESSKYD
ncbi:MAG: ammonium transporter [Cytophagaceae bacterium]|nr:ammonium transporter [Cytophagaceae bacterium]